MGASRSITGDDKRGSAAGRRARKRFLLAEYGDGETCPCAFCGKALTFDTVTADRFPLRGCDGGTYARNNIRPACLHCNSSDGALNRKGKTNGSNRGRSGTGGAGLRAVA